MKTMKKIFTIMMTILFCLSSINLHAEVKDTPGCKDHPLFTRMPGYWMRNCDHKQFDGRDFDIKKGGTPGKIRVEGELWHNFYILQPEIKPIPSELQIKRNFANAVNKIGGTHIGTTNNNWEIYEIIKDGKEIWVAMAWSYPTGYQYIIIQKGDMAQDIEANAEVFSNDIRTTGHAAVYGIYFDTGKSNIKPESAQAIAEITKLLKSDPGLKIHVVGHTDNVGGVESNIKLSQGRAESVVQALIKNGIASGRLKAFGCGQFAPVMSNKNEDGRAKNRRVELVEQ
jgi:OOP family OmpA-OmpF porin